MARSYRVETGAARDLEEAIDYLTGESRAVAIRFVESCVQTLELLAERPRIGRVYPARDDRIAGMRWFPVRDFGAWLVFYRPLDVVSVERVLHGSRDLDRILRGDPPG